MMNDVLSRFDVTNANIAALNILNELSDFPLTAQRLDVEKYINSVIAENKEIDAKALIGKLMKLQANYEVASTGFIKLDRMIETLRKL